VVWAEVLAEEDERVFLTLGLASRSQPSPGRRRAWQRAAERAGLAGLRLAPGGRLGPWEIGRESGVVCFQDGGLEMWAVPGMFCQANFQANRLLTAEVASAAGPGEGRRALDLYAGGGNFSLPLARNGWRVLAVEGAAGARSAGLFQLKRNPDLPEVRFQRGEVGRTLKRLAEKRARFDLAVLDPPRPGAKGLMPLLAALGPRRIIYVSCHPAALARDAAALGEQGYRAASLAVVDMFPQTSHVEAVLTLDRER
jgi:23S rRNA (uracil1939-C5)-methyltransferase